MANNNLSNRAKVSLFVFTAVLTVVAIFVFQLISANVAGKIRIVVVLDTPQPSESLTEPDVVIFFAGGQGTIVDPRDGWVANLSIEQWCNMLAKSPEPSRCIIHIYKHDDLDDAMEYSQQLSEGIKKLKTRPPLNNTIWIESWPWGTK